MSVSSNILKENSRDLLREEEPGDDEVEFPINDEDEDFSITSIRIVLVDSDPESLCLMKNLMTQYSYQGIKSHLIRVSFNVFNFLSISFKLGFMIRVSLICC